MGKYFILTLLFVCAMLAGNAQTGEKYIVNAKNLNLRSGSGEQYEVLVKLTLGDTVSLIAKTTADWWQVKYGTTEGYVFAQYLKIDPSNGWEKKTYQSGSTPECENVTPKYDYELDNYLRVSVGSGTDVVVKLMKVTGNIDECIRITYIRSGDTYEIKNIPEGRYYLKIAYGKDYSQKIEGNVCYVKFMKNSLYEKGVQILDYNLIREANQTVGRDTYENWSVPSYELFLDVVITDENNPGFITNEISEKEFNK